jgi:plasmid stabilization system protein ParE
MAKRRVIWTSRAHSELYEILDYYARRNKSRIYSAKLHSNIKQKLKSLDFSIALPQKTSKPNIFYFTHNHISVFFSFQDNDIFVKSVWDERRNPQSIESILQKTD